MLLKPCFPTNVGYHLMFPQGICCPNRLFSSSEKSKLSMLVNNWCSPNQSANFLWIRRLFIIDSIWATWGSDYSSSKLLSKAALTRHSLRFRCIGSKSWTSISLEVKSKISPLLQHDQGQQLPRVLLLLPRYIGRRSRRYGLQLFLLLVLEHVRDIWSKHIVGQKNGNAEFLKWSVIAATTSGFLFIREKMFHSTRGNSRTV